MTPQVQLDNNDNVNKNLMFIYNTHRKIIMKSDSFLCSMADHYTESDLKKAKINHGSFNGKMRIHSNMIVSKIEPFSM